MTYKMLLIEDVNFVMQGQALMLSQSGFELELSENGKKAIRICKNICFDIILSDLGLPDLHAREVMLEIKRNSLNKFTPIFGLTAHVDPDERRRCLHSGMRKIFIKPLTQDIIEELMVMCRLVA